MSKECDVTGKTPMTGNNVSHANNKTKRKFNPNLHYKKFWSEAKQSWIRLRVTKKGIKKIDKLGLDAVLASMM